MVAALAAAGVALAPSAHAQATRYEAETAACEGTIESNYAGFSGSGFCNPPNRLGAGVQFTVYAGSPGTFTLGIKYTNGTGVNRSAVLSANGTVVQSAVAFEPTGAWRSNGGI